MKFSLLPASTSDYRDAVWLLRQLRIAPAAWRFTPGAPTFAIAKLLEQFKRVRLVPYGRYKGALLYHAVLTARALKGVSR